MEKYIYQPENVYYIKCGSHDNQIIFQTSTLLRYANSELTRVLINLGPSKILHLDCDYKVLSLIVQAMKIPSSVDWRNLTSSHMTLAMKYCHDFKLREIWEEIEIVYKTSCVLRDMSSDVVDLCLKPILSHLKKNNCPEAIVTKISNLMFELAAWFFSDQLGDFGLEEENENGIKSFSHSPRSQTCDPQDLDSENKHDIHDNNIHEEMQ